MMVNAWTPEYRHVIGIDFLAAVSGELFSGTL
jgi:hypothetical protein